LCQQQQQQQHHEHQLQGREPQQWLLGQQLLTALTAVSVLPLLLLQLLPART
jgi:hypothetical protein